MSDATDRTTAIARVKLYTAYASEPALTDAEVETIVDECTRGLTWVNNTAYVVGTIIRPTVGNGHSYLCIQAGTSAVLLADEPEWSEVTANIIEDGVSDPVLQWQENGYVSPSAYDVPLAIHKAWTIKAARAAEWVSSREGKWSDVYAHCIQMAAQTAPFKIN